MNLEERIQSFIELGKVISSLIENIEDSGLLDIIERSKIKNNWFTRKNVLNSFSSIINMLEESSIRLWINSYDLIDRSYENNVLIVMAGNIPMVGFHDFLCVLITGNKAILKLSKNDTILIPYLYELLCKINKKFIGRVQFIEEIKRKNFEAVIATGSDNSFSYFEYYFRNSKKILRKNRTSISVLSGKENKHELNLLGDDIFMYFGLGCRNVSKLFIPNDFDLDILFDVFYRHKDIINNRKYANNYEYNKTIYLMGNHKVVENGFVILKEDKLINSPVSVLLYEYYNEISLVKDYIHNNIDRIQCVVSNESLGLKTVQFGRSQFPEIYDYADDIDTINFLESLI